MHLAVTKGPAAWATLALVHLCYANQKAHKPLIQEASAGLIQPYAQLTFSGSP